MARSTLVWRGVLAVIVGLIALSWPGITIGAFVLIFAIYAFIAGGMEAVRAFRAESAGPVVGRLALAALDILAGVVALAWPGITVLVAVLWIAAWALVTGIVDLGLTFQTHSATSDRVLHGLTGVVLLLFALSLYIHPGIGVLSLAEIYGLFSLFSGVTLLFSAFTLQNTGTRSSLRDRLGV
jgi:uncharacterized membrane protein HdeD (DUF308 family)